MLVNSKAYVSHTIAYKKEEPKSILDELTGELVMIDKYFKLNPSGDLLFKSEGYFHFERDLESIQVRIFLSEDTVFVQDSDSKKLRLANPIKELRFIVVGEQTPEGSGELALCFLKR